MRLEQANSADRPHNSPGDGDDLFILPSLATFVPWYQPQQGIKVTRFICLTLQASIL
jgi:hypothetical protein